MRFGIDIVKTGSKVYL